MIRDNVNEVQYINGVKRNKTKPSRVKSMSADCRVGKMRLELELGSGKLSLGLRIGL